MAMHARRPASARLRLAQVRRRAATDGGSDGTMPSMMGFAIAAQQEEAGSARCLRPEVTLFAMLERAATAGDWHRVPA
jgi:hypothetical protein